MSTSLKIQVDPRTRSIAGAIRQAARLAPLLVVSGRAFGDLVGELGSVDAAGRYLCTLAEEIGHPIGVNGPTSAASSSTAFISPRSWSRERVAGWAAGHHQELEDAFGDVTHAR